MFIEKAGVDYFEVVVRKTFSDHGKPFRKLLEQLSFKTADSAEASSLAKPNRADAPPLG